MKMNTWKTLTVSSLVTLLFFIGLPQAKADESKKHIDVYKTPTCGCCVDWIKHIEEKDFITAAAVMKSFSSMCFIQSTQHPQVGVL